MRYEGAELDSCLLKERDGGAVLPDEQDVEPTHDPAHPPVVLPTHLTGLTPGALTVINTFSHLLVFNCDQHFVLAEFLSMSFIVKYLS